MRLLGLMIVRPGRLIRETEAAIRAGICPSCGAYRCQVCRALILAPVDHTPACPHYGPFE